MELRGVQIHLQWRKKMGGGGGYLSGGTEGGTDTLTVDY